MKRFLFIELIIILLLIGCINNPDKNPIVDDYEFHVNPISQQCNQDLQILKIDNFNDYQSSDLTDNYSEDFFNSKILLYIQGVQAGISDIITVDRIFIYEGNLQIMYWAIGALTAPYCYEIVIEISNDINFNEIHYFKTLGYSFKNDDNCIISIYTLGVDDVFVIYDTMDKSYISYSKIIIGDVTSTINDVYFSGLSIESEEIVLYYMDYQTYYLEYNSERYDYIENNE